MAFDASSYVERSADRELYEALSSAEYAYVLNARQMGKSSLAVRTIEHLKADGISTVFIDLTRIGSATVSPEQWYAGLLMDLARGLVLRQAATKFFASAAQTGPSHRFFTFIQEVVLAETRGSIVVLIDEIDATRSLSFAADEFFAGIRELYNGRASNPELKRLSFCLMGAALPGDLMQDTRLTPFNVGKRIELKDFTLQEASVLAAGLPGDGTKTLERVMHWTSGHPFLTQTICSEIARTAAPVDEAVQRLYLDKRMRETDSNLADVGNRILGRGDPNATDESRSSTLTLLGSMRGKGIEDDEANPAVARLKMSGVARLKDGRLFLRNRIYETVFDRAWVTENMPGQELRRQRTAFWLGVARTAIVSAIVCALVGTLALVNRNLALRNADLAQRATETARAAEYREYVADLKAMRAELQDRNYSGVFKLLEQTRNSPYRNIEWDYWNHLVHSATLEVPLGIGKGSLNFALDGKSLAIVDPSDNSAKVYSYPDLGHLLFQTGAMPLTSVFGELGSRWVRLDTIDKELRVADGQSGKSIAVLKVPAHIADVAILPGRSEIAVFEGNDPPYRDSSSLSIWSWAPFRLVHRYRVGSGRIRNAVTSREGKVGVFLLDTPGGGSVYSVVDLERGKETWSFAPPRNEYPGIFRISSDGRFLATGTTRGRFIVRDLQRRTIVFDAQPFKSFVSGMRFSDDGRRLFVFGDQTGQVYDLVARRLLGEGYGWDGDIAGDGQSFAMVGYGLRCYRFESRAPSFRQLPFICGVLGVDSRGRLELVTVTPTTGYLLDPNTLKVVVGPFRAGYFSDLNWRCISEADGVSVVSTETGRRVCLLSGLKTPPDVLSANAQGTRFFASDLGGGYVAAFDSNGRKLWLRKVKGETPFFSQSSPDGSTCIAQISGLQAVVLDGKTGQELRRLDEPGEGFFSVAFARSGRQFAWASGPDLMIENTDLKGPVVRASGHASVIESVEFSPDDKRILTSSVDGTIRLWDAQTGEELLRLGSGQGAYASACFNKDGTAIYATDDRAVLSVFRLK